VVTGGAGFIGRHVVRHCLAAGAAVRVVDRRLPADGDPRADHVTLDLARTSAAELLAVLRDATDLVHLAAEKHNLAGDRPTDVYRANVLGTHALFSAARSSGVQRVVFASSLYVYGRTEGGAMHEDEPARPRTAYGISKLAGEHALADLCATTAIPGTALRYFFVYGPGQAESEGPRSLIPRTLEALRCGEAPVVFGDGTQALDYVHVDDVARATLAGLDARLHGTVVNIGSGRPTPVAEVVGTLLRLAGRPLRLTHEQPDRTAGTSRFADIGRARQALAWAPRISLEEGLGGLLEPFARAAPTST
jgi:UDP-glucose 4-epimerase